MKILQKAFAEACSAEQAEMINELGRLVYMRCNAPGCGGMDSQLCYVADDLDEHGQRFVKCLADFIKLKEDKST